MRQLWAGSCICTGDVSLSFEVPGGHLKHHEFVAPKRSGEKEDINAAMREELHLDQDRTLTKKLKEKITKYRDLFKKQS